MTLQDGVVRGVPQLMFEDSLIKLDKNFAVFITMVRAPGQALRCARRTFTAVLRAESWVRRAH